MAPTRKYDLYSKEFRSQSHAVFARMRQSDPVFQQAGLDGKTPIWFVTRYPEVEQVLLDSQRFVLDPTLVCDPVELEMLLGSSDPQVEAMINNHMLNKDGEVHHRLHSLVSKAFTPKVIQNLRPRIEEIAQGLLDRVVQQGKMELISEYAFPLPITVIAELLGVPMHNRDQFREWSNAFVRPAITPQEQL